MVVWVVSMGGSSPVSTRIIDWSFTVMLGTVGIFHIARGVDEAMINNVAADAARTLAAESVIHKASNGHVTTVVSGE
jgi:hypothetical protein